MDIIKIIPAFTDERGSLWDLLTNENIKHIGFLDSKKNSIRAKHFHKKEKHDDTTDAVEAELVAGAELPIVAVCVRLAQ